MQVRNHLKVTREIRSESLGVGPSHSEASATNGHLHPPNDSSVQLLLQVLELSRSERAHANMAAGAAHQSRTSSAPKRRRTIVAFIHECQWRASPRYEGKVREAAPVEGNLLLHNSEKNDNAIMPPLCECGGVRHDSSAITPQDRGPRRLIGIN